MPSHICTADIVLSCKLSVAAMLSVDCFYDNRLDRLGAAETDWIGN